MVPLRCRCWHCDECRPDRAARLVYEAKSGNPTLFITLTTHRRPGRSPDAAARNLAHAWRRFRRQYVKAHGKGSLAFLTVFEATRQGWPHLHIVARCKWIDQRQLSKFMGAEIGAPVVDVRRIKGQSEVAGYISKYIGKNPQRFAGTKRYWRSLDYLLPVAGYEAGAGANEPGWQVVRRALMAYVKALEPFFNVVDLAPDYALLSYRRPP